MTTYGDSKYKIYQLRGLPAGAFGETYIVATAIHIAPHAHKLECFVMTQRPKAALYKAAFPFHTDGLSEEYVSVDFDSLIEQALQQAELYVVQRLSELADEYNKPDIAWLPFQIEECHARPFVGCWIRGSFHPEISEVASLTECESLATYLKAVSSISYMRGPGR